ncbi:retinoblastoma-like protein 2 isoform X2 [Xiphophorus couchianus]|uniref:retinoblastoma-like protein 2 isoform X2 n=1 Tax=Xiphophorus couchianus TaxID=32473 RepID=UPI0010169FDF|nr:retinoblastoma-like protein 2 isoform X2 [Xiphophorus couchianus]
MATAPGPNVEKPGPGPSDRLITLFRTCSRDPTQGIKIRLKDMLQEFLQHCKDDQHDNAKRELEEKCFSKATEHYYTILESLTGIQVRLKSGVGVIACFLEDDLWHRCLVACCLQIALKLTFRVSDVTLLLKVFKLDSYLFLKVHNQFLLRFWKGKFMDSIRRFKPIGTSVLESSVWASHSRLWEKIKDNEGFPPFKHQLTSPTNVEGQPESNPQEDVILEAESSTTSDHQHCSSAVSRPKGQPFLHQFARMVYSEMGERLREMCLKLHVSDELMSKMWTCLENSLAQHTSLMKDGHLDHLLISAIYIIAKATKNKLTFEEIVAALSPQTSLYRSMTEPYTNESVSKEMLNSESPLENLPKEMMDLGTHRAAFPTPEENSVEDKRGSLINFYHLYSIKLQPFAEKFAQTYGGETPPISPLPPPPSRKSYHPTKGVNFTVSPLNRQDVPQHTPKYTYKFGKSSREDLCKINNGTRKRALSFKTEEEDGPSSKQSCLENPSALQSRLINLQKDRSAAQNQNNQNHPDDTHCKTQ